MFASDYPHHEGTDDPITRFEKTMLEIDEDTKKKFYCNNFKDLLGSHIVKKKAQTKKNELKVLYYILCKYT